MKKLTLVVDERELSTVRAALLLLQEHVDALPEDLAEMIAAHGMPMAVPEIERLSLQEEALTRRALALDDREHEANGRRQREAEAFRAELKRRSEQMAREAAEAIGQAVKRMEETRRSAVVAGEKARQEARAGIRQAEATAGSGASRSSNASRRSADRSPSVKSGRGGAGRLGTSPKCRSISCVAVATSKSPATASTALPEA